MNKEIIQTAIRNGTLRKYDLTKAQAGDKVFGWKPGEVLALYGEEVVIGWDVSDRKSVHVYRNHCDHEIYLAPLCWVEDKPVYKGDVLYSKHGGINKRVISHVEVLGNPERFRLVTVCGLWEPPEKLSWTDPSSYEVEGKVLKVGDTLFSKDGGKVTITAFEMGCIITTPGQVMGGTHWTADYLSWTDPTILFEVEGKPVRKGDVLYGTWWGNQPNGYEITGIDRDGRPMWQGCALTSKPENLTWTKPKAAPLNINGHLVPAPEREPLPYGTAYCIPSLFDGKAARYAWYDDQTDHYLLNSGLIHLTEEAATAHAQALISISKS